MWLSIAILDDLFAYDGDVLTSFFEAAAGEEEEKTETRAIGLMTLSFA
jgi:hypothetical protein